MAFAFLPKPQDHPYADGVINLLADCDRRVRLDVGGSGNLRSSARSSCEGRSCIVNMMQQWSAIVFLFFLPPLLPLQVAANPLQEIVWQWNFDQDTPQAIPSGFVAISTAGAEAPDWQVLADGEAPTPGQLVVQNRPCTPSGCAHLLVADHVRATYPDVVVQIKDMSSDGHGEAGIALAILDNGTFYAVTLNASASTVTVRLVSNGQTTVLGEVPVKLAARPWHTIRVQRINFLHLDKGRLGVFIDGAQVAAVDDAVLPQEGRIGLITFGRTAAKFDGLHILDLVSNRPLSGPAAY